MKTYRQTSSFRFSNTENLYVDRFTKDQGKHFLKEHLPYVLSDRLARW